MKAATPISQKWSLLVTSSGLVFSRWMSEKPKSLSMLARDSGTREMSQAACEKTLRFSTVGKGWGAAVSVSSSVG